MISVVTIAILFIVWWVNGAELEDMWLYIVGVTIVATPAVDEYFKKKRGKD